MEAESLGQLLGRKSQDEQLTAMEGGARFPFRVEGAKELQEWVQNIPGGQNKGSPRLLVWPLWTSLVEALVHGVWKVDLVPVIARDNFERWKPSVYASRRAIRS